MSRPHWPTSIYSMIPRVSFNQLFHSTTVQFTVAFSSVLFALFKAQWQDSTLYIQFFWVLLETWILRSTTDTDLLKICTIIKTSHEGKGGAHPSSQHPEKSSVFFLLICHPSVYVRHILWYLSQLLCCMNLNTWWRRDFLLWNKGYDWYCCVKLKAWTLNYEIMSVIFIRVISHQWAHAKVCALLINLCIHFK